MHLCIYLKFFALYSCYIVSDLRRNRDFDPFDLRLRLPAVVSKVYKAINRNGGITYVHCTAGLGRAPAVAVGESCF